MDGAAFTFFDTPIGRCALVWRGGAIVGAALPDADDRALRRALERRFPGALPADPPVFVRDAVAAVRRLLAGERERFADVPIDLSGIADFDRRVLAAASAIPPGETRTYGDIAATLGSPGAARAVGRALGANPLPILIPCHRILAAAGRAGGFSAPGGAATKLKMLAIEGAARGGAPSLFEDLPLAIRPD